MSLPMSDERGGEGQAARAWPAGRVYSEEESVVATCGSCAVEWRAHRSMAGFKLRCECGAWVEVPARSTSTLMLQGIQNGEPSQSGAQQSVVPFSGVSTTIPSSTGDAALVWQSHSAYDPAPALSFPAEAGSLEGAHPRDRAAWTNRTLVEFFAFLAAIFLPNVLARMLSRGEEFTLLLPFAAVTSAGLVIVVAAITRAYGTSGFRRAKPRYWIEALGAAGAAVVFAMLWIVVVKSMNLKELVADDLDQVRATLGIGWALVVFALVPPFVEEIAFRGMLQGRLSALLGANSGLWLTALLFALCHMAPVVFPIHFGLGLYLGWLRQRGGSVLPGMLFHGAYNAAILFVTV